jgi:hypothetical protein
MTEKTEGSQVTRGRASKQPAGKVTTPPEGATTEEVELLRKELRITKDELEALNESLGTPDQWEQVINKISGLTVESQYKITMGIYTAILGSVVLILTLLWKLQPFGIQVSKLETTEFIIAILVGTLLVLIGGFLQTYSYKAQLDGQKSELDTKESLIRDLAHLRADITRNFVDAKYKAASNFLPGRPTSPDIPPTQSAEGSGSKRP